MFKQVRKSIAVLCGLAVFAFATAASADIYMHKKGTTGTSQKGSQRLSDIYMGKGKRPNVADLYKMSPKESLFADIYMGKGKRTIA